MSRRPPPEAGCACAGRRRFLRGLVVALPAAVPVIAAGEVAVQRKLRLTNTHTGEELETAYYADGAYQPAQLGLLDWILRDHRTSDILAIDQRLFDLLFELADSAGVEPHYQVISGYRSPATNSMLAARSDGVSSQSLHMQGRAIDIRPVGMPTATLRDLALARQAGGVGFYAGSDFVHLDTGRVRSWTG